MTWSSCRRLTELHLSPLRPELPQMMVEVFIHATTPLLRSERPEKGMRVPGTLRFPALVKLTHLQLELLLLAKKIPLVGDHEFLVGGIILRERLLVGVDRFDERCEHSSDEDARQVQ